MGRIILFSFFIFLTTAVSAQVGSSVNNAGIANEIANTELKVFPNPVVEYFQISNNSSIKKVIVYNMFGKEVRTFYPVNNGQYDVADLKAGMYIIKILDEKGKVVKSVKLQKNFTNV